MPETALPLKPYHLFQHDENYYCLSVEDMRAQALSGADALLLKKFSAALGTLPSPAQINLLQKLQLWDPDIRQAQNKPSNQAIPPLTVITLSLILTDSCNLRCSYCYGHGSSEGRMSEKTALQAVDWLFEQSGNKEPLCISFFGGEPFLMFPLIKTIAAYARAKAEAAAKKIVFYVTTNGTLLNEEIISFLLEYQVEIMVSFDGPKEIHDLQRPFTNGRGSYDLILPKLKMLLAAIPQAVVHAVITEGNDPDKIRAALKALGFKRITAVYASHSSLNLDQGQDPTPRDFTPLIEANKREAETWLKLIKKRDGQALRQLVQNNRLSTAITDLLHQRKSYHACGAGIGLLSVAVNGDLYLCHRFNGSENYRLGSVFNKEINSETYRESPALSHPLCRTCFARYYCAGNCKYDNAASCGSINKPPQELCHLKRSELELAVYVVANLSILDQKFLFEEEVISPKPCLLDF